VLELKAFAIGAAIGAALLFAAQGAEAAPSALA
jgi:hypothetical protein